MIKTNVLTLARFDLSQTALADHGAHTFEVSAVFCLHQCTAASCACERKPNA
jgi:hypothetical protein